MWSTNASFGAINPLRTPGQQPIHFQRDQGDGEASHGWVTAVDPATQRMFFYHSGRGESSWVKPPEVQEAEDAAASSNSDQQQPQPWVGGGGDGWGDGVSLAHRDKNRPNPPPVRRLTKYQSPFRLADDVAKILGLGDDSGGDDSGGEEGGEVWDGETKTKGKGTAKKRSAAQDFWRQVLEATNETQPVLRGVPMLKSQRRDADPDTFADYVARRLRGQHRQRSAAGASASSSAASAASATSAASSASSSRRTRISSSYDDGGDGGGGRGGHRTGMAHLHHRAPTENLRYQLVHTAKSVHHYIIHIQCTRLRFTSTLRNEHCQPTELSSETWHLTPDT